MTTDKTTAPELPARIWAFEDYPGQGAVTKPHPRRNDSMSRLPQAKDDPRCSCVDGQYECWHCRKPELEAIERRLTPAQREYDRLAMSGWRTDDDYDSYDGPGCCSCHISAPCGYCESHCADCGEHNDDCTCHDEAAS